jgi:hypothetical protein
MLIAELGLKMLFPPRTVRPAQTGVRLRQGRRIARRKGIFKLAIEPLISPALRPGRSRLYFSGLRDHNAPRFSSKMHNGSKRLLQDIFQGNGFAPGDPTAAS